MTTKKNYILFMLSRHYNEREYTWKPSYYNKEALIHYIAQAEFYNSCYRIIENLVNSMDDTVDIITERRRLGYFRYTVERHRYYLAKVTNGCITKVDIEEFKGLIDKEVEEIKKKREKTLKIKAAKDRCSRYTFRRGSVPHVHKRKWHRCSYYRSPSTTGVKRKEFYIDEEYTFRDAKIKHLPSCYDDLVRHTDRSWKTSYKVKKQWMKNSNTHVDTVRHSKQLEHLERIKQDELIA